ncbi:MAG: DUF4384 domain-containing protein [Candidatus Hydrogenedentes bacterium]|nr:DUF4384 domain-containing protein [Candidatus Hydrogenedentota bacterium]
MKSRQLHIGRRRGKLLAQVALMLAALTLDCGPVFAEEPADPAQQIADMTVSNLAQLGGNTIVVFPFPYSDGIKSIEGSLLSERIATTLSEQKAARVLERELLDKIMAEQKLSASGLVDPATSVQVGKLLGAHGIVAGTVTDLGENIEIHARLVKVETAESVAVVKITTRKTIKTFISPLWSEIDRIKADSASFHVAFSVENGPKPTEIPSYRVGDFLTLRFTADRDCYVTIFDFTTSGSIHVLFPNSLMTDNKIKAGREYVLPSEQAGFKIRVTDPPGIEKLKLFATTKKIPLFAEDFSQESFRSINDGNYSPTRDLQAVVDSLEKNAWAESHLEIRIERALRGTTDAK